MPLFCFFSGVLCVPCGHERRTRSYASANSSSLLIRIRARWSNPWKTSLAKWSCDPHPLHPSIVPAFSAWEGNGFGIDSDLPITHAFSLFLDTQGSCIPIRHNNAFKLCVFAHMREACAVVVFVTQLLFFQPAWYLRVVYIIFSL